MNHSNNSLWLYYHKDKREGDYRRSRLRHFSDPPQKAEATPLTKKLLASKKQDPAAGSYPGFEIINGPQIRIVNCMNCFQDEGPAAAPAWLPAGRISRPEICSPGDTISVQTNYAAKITGNTF